MLGQVNEGFKGFRGLRCLSHLHRFASIYVFYSSEDMHLHRMYACPPMTRLQISSLKSTCGGGWILILQDLLRVSGFWVFLVEFGSPLGTLS